MRDLKPTTQSIIEFVRLLFPLPQEEEIAVALTRFLAVHAGSQIDGLRPEMTMEEVLQLGRSDTWSTVEFSYMLELAGIETLEDELAQMTFREFVRFCAGERQASA